MLEGKFRRSPLNQFFHVGGDEVNFGCWQADPAITQWMHEHDLHSYFDLQAYYEQHMQNITFGLNRTPVYWNEAFGNQVFPLNTKAVIQIWNKNNSEIVNVVQKGYRALFSSPWYLDRQVPGPNQHWFWMDTWNDFYSAEPTQGLNLTPQQLKLLIGGEGCMWGEQVDDTAMDVRVWPRACAFAERLWSAEEVNSVQAATPRLGSHRCRMLRRGVHASPIYPDYCYTGNNDI